MVGTIDMKAVAGSRYICKYGRYRGAAPAPPSAMLVHLHGTAVWLVRYKL